MSSNRYTDALEEIEQLERQRRLQLSRDKDKEKKIRTRLEKTLGEIIIKHFPAITIFQPKLNQAAINYEFEPLGVFFSTISKDRKYEELFQKIVSQKQKESTMK